MTIITPTGITGINSITSSGSTLVFQSASGTSPTVSGLNNITSSGIITATGFVGNLTGNINSTGVSTIATLNVSQSNPTNLNVSGVTTVSAGSASAPSISPSEDSNTGIFFPSPDTIAFAEGGVEALRIDSSANIGIGTASPGAKLDVRGGNDTIIRAKVASGQYGGIMLLSEEGNDLTLGYARNSSNYGNDTSAGDLSIKATSSSAVNLHFVVGSGNATTKMKIDSSGRVIKPLVPAFLAYHQASDLTYIPGQTLSYPFTLYNIGNHYNTSTSTFTAPVAGRYLFSINANGDWSGSYAGIPRAYWKINGSNVANGIHLRGPDATDQGLEQRSQTVIFNLSANDTVNMVVGENRWDIFGANFFMGYLIG
jgi:hypothetical protein